MDATSIHSLDSLLQVDPSKMNSASMSPGGRLPTLHGNDDFHPFELWVAGCWRQGEVEFQDDDVILGEKVAARFALGINREKNAAVLGVVDRDAEPIRAMPWTSAALLAGVKGREWIALSARDARVGNARELAPRQLRLFIPLDLVVYKAIMAIPDGKISIISMNNKKLGVVKIRETLMTIPFKKL